MPPNTEIEKKGNKVIVSGMSSQHSPFSICVSFPSHPLLTGRVSSNYVTETGRKSCVLYFKKVAG